jgi:hypothetical protein
MDVRVQTSLIRAFLMWVFDLKDMLDESLTRPAHRRYSAKVKKLGQIITYATAVHVGISIDFHPMCWRRPNRQPCEGVLQIEMRKDFIYWHCPVCDDEGVVTGWSGLMWDMTEFRSPIAS